MTKRTYTTEEIVETLRYLASIQNIGDVEGSDWLSGFNVGRKNAYECAANIFEGGPTTGTGGE